MMACPGEDSPYIPPRFPDFRAFLLEGPNEPGKKRSRWPDVGIFRCRTDQAGNSFLHRRVVLDGAYYVLRLYPLKSSITSDKGGPTTLRLAGNRRAA